MRGITKLILTFILCVTFLIITNNARADSSKFIEEDIDVGSTVLVRAELGRKGWFYWIDSNACICWIGGKQALDGTAVASTFDCLKVKAHPKLERHVKNCVKEESSSPAAAAQHAAQPTEVKPAQQPTATAPVTTQPAALPALPQKN